MKRLQRAAILIELIDKLRDHGSWCGETHIQKAVYFLQELLDVPTEFEFILYKYGPFSFDLRDELLVMCADELLDIEPNIPPYGPSIVITSNAEEIRGNFPKTLAKYRKKINFVVEKLGSKGVSELEGLATALYVLKTSKETSSEKLATELKKLKPHISIDQAIAFIKEVQNMQSTVSKVA